jgi:hypothetical protein
MICSFRSFGNEDFHSRIDSNSRDVHRFCGDSDNSLNDFIPTSITRETVPVGWWTEVKMRLIGKLQRKEKLFGVAPKLKDDLRWNRGEKLRKRYRGKSFYLRLLEF